MTKVYEFTQEIAQEICDAVSTSTFGIKKLCKLHKHWPSHETIRKWQDDPSLSFAGQYARAKTAQIDAMVERIFVLTRDMKKGYLFDGEGNTHADQTYLTKMKCEIDAIKWLASKLAPKIYGESKQTQDTTQDAITQFRVTNEPS